MLFQQQTPMIVPQPIAKVSMLPAHSVTARRPSTFGNPLLVADFNMPQHPYQTHYVPANAVQQQSQPASLLQPPLNGINGYGAHSFY